MKFMCMVLELKLNLCFYSSTSDQGNSVDEGAELQFVSSLPSVGFPLIRALPWQASRPCIRQRGFEPPLYK